VSVQPMSKATERRILAALDATTDGVEAGLDPTEAVIKAARAQQLGPGHVPLLVRAFNVASATRHRKSAATREEKADTYPMADADEAIRRLYGSSKAAVAPAEDYARPPDWYAPIEALQARQARELAVKAASEARAQVDTPPRTPEDLFFEKMAQVRGLSEAVFDLSRRRLHERDAYDAALEKLATILVTPGQPALEDVRRTARTGLDTAATALLDSLASKDASVRQRPATGRLVGMSDPTIALIKTALDHARHLVALDVALGDLVALRDTAEASLRLPPQEPEERPLDAFVRTKAAENRGILGSVSAGLGAASGGNLANTIASRFGDGHDQAVKRVLDQIATPAHEQELRGIRTAAMLSDLLQNDPVVAAHNDPMEVSDTFNRLGEFAPRLADQPLVMQAMLRKSLQAPLEPFDVQAFGKMDSSDTGRGFQRAQRPAGRDLTPYFASALDRSAGVAADNLRAVAPGKSVAEIFQGGRRETASKPDKPAGKPAKPAKSTKPDDDDPLS
jgi:hypothetical protein